MMRTIAVALCCASAMLGVGGAVLVAQADRAPLLQLQFYDCTGPDGTPSTLDVVHIGGGPVLLLADGSGVFVVMESFDVTTNTLRFTTTGLDYNSLLAPVTCLVTFPLIDGNPLSGHILQQTGIVAGPDAIR
jgi:hypothetical protein